MNGNKRQKHHNDSRCINMPSIAPPPLIPAPHLIKKKLNGSSDLHHNNSSSFLNENISLINPFGQHKDDINSSLVDARLEIDCLKSTLVGKNELISSNQEEMERLEAKSVCLESKLNEEKTIRENQMVELVRLQNLLAESAKIQEANHTAIVNLEAEVNRLRAQLRIALHRSVSDSADEMPKKKRKKMLHKCSHCGYSTFRENAMTTHRQEGCPIAVKEKCFSCVVCKGKFTYNSFRYHLNQYTKGSSHAKNGHQNYSPEKHRQMLEKLKQTKQ